jgi:hypothetical protein
MSSVPSTKTNSATGDENSPASKILRLMEKTLEAFQISGAKDVISQNYRDISFIINSESGLLQIDETANKLNSKISDLLVACDPFIETIKQTVKSTPAHSLEQQIFNNHTRMTTFFLGNKIQPLLSQFPGRFLPTPTTKANAKVEDQAPQPLSLSPGK